MNTNSIHEIFNWFFNEMLEAQHEIAFLKNAPFDPAEEEQIAYSMVEDGLVPASELYKTYSEREEEHRVFTAHQVQMERLRIVQSTQLSHELAMGVAANCIAFFEEQISTRARLKDLYVGYGNLTAAIQEKNCAQIDQFRKFIRVLIKISESTKQVTH